MWRVEHLVDIDLLAQRLHAVIAKWKLQARVGPLTWRDERASCPQLIVTDCVSVQVPESRGIRLWQDPDGGLEAVVWAGGWVGRHRAPAQVGCEQSLSGFHDVDGANAAVVRTVEDFLA
jgi:hypothetical protein